MQALQHLHSSFVNEYCSRAKSGKRTKSSFMATTEKPARSSAGWSKALDGVLHDLNNVLSSVGLVEKDSSLLSDVKQREQNQQLAAGHSSLEQELITAGGSDTLLTKERKKVLALSPTELLQKLREGSMSAVLVLQSHQAMAIEESKRTNCVTEFIPDAKKWAESLDAVKFGQMSDVQLPLHGLPVSVTDSIAVQGLDSTLGLRKMLEHPSEQDAVIIKVLKKLGAIPFVKTNTSQLGLSPGCSNPLWGMTVHPQDPTRTAGGSSGGEAALISGRGSVLGFGTDLTGGVRLPAGWCGVVSLKPTSSRLSNKGVTYVPAPMGISGTVGMIGRNGSIVVEATKAILSADFNQHDVTVPPLTWNDSIYLGMSKKFLRIGWFDTTGLLPSTPGVRRAVAEAIAAYKKAGHELVAFSPPELVEGLKLFMDLLMADQGSSAYSLLKGELVDPALSWYKQCTSVPPQVRHLTKPIMRRQFGDIAADHCLGSLCSIADLWKKIIERSDYCDRFLQAWKKEEIDLLVSPVFPSPAPKKEQCGKLSVACLSTMLFNLLDYPAATVPVCRHTEKDEKELDKFETSDCVYELLKESATGAVGLPLSVQVVALPFCEELICRGIIDLSKNVNFKL
ncbi:Amidase signature domain [Trinorchestia longiramus]|nr:Amidase signature domain [Trinorchestia longiramus]